MHIWTKCATKLSAQLLNAQLLTSKILSWTRFMSQCFCQASMTVVSTILSWNWRKHKNHKKVYKCSSWEGPRSSHHCNIVHAYKSTNVHVKKVLAHHIIEILSTRTTHCVLWLWAHFFISLKFGWLRKNAHSLLLFLAKFVIRLQWLEIWRNHTGLYERMFPLMFYIFRVEFLLIEFYSNFKEIELSPVCLSYAAPRPNISA